MRTSATAWEAPRRVSKRPRASLPERAFSSWRAGDEVACSQRSKLRRDRSASGWPSRSSARSRPNSTPPNSAIRERVSRAATDRSGSGVTASRAPHRWPLALSSALSLLQQLPCRRHHVVGREAELLHHRVAVARKPEAVDTDVRIGVARPCQGRTRLHRYRWDRAIDDLIPVRHRLLLEQEPTRK